MRPMSRIALLAAVAFAALTGTAHAGGWATVELGEMPSGLEAGKTWRVELIVKQHGITPMAGVTPSVRINNGAGAVRTFTARPTAKVGTYVADVTFPSGGTWKTQPLRRLHGRRPAPAVTADCGERRRRSASAGDFPWPQTVAIAFVALLFLGGVIATVARPFRRRRRAGAMPRPVAQ